MSEMIEVTKSFKDYDGMTVKAGTIGYLEKKGRREKDRKDFYNIISTDRSTVLAVTLEKRFQFRPFQTPTH